MELRRQYHCHAYNMLVAIISCTQTKIQFYTTFLFKEDLNKGVILWDNIIDTSKRYHFECELEVGYYMLEVEAFMLLYARDRAL